MFQILYFLWCLFLMGDVFGSQEINGTDALINSLKEIKSDDEMVNWCKKFFEEGIGYQDVSGEQKKVAEEIIKSPYRQVCNKPLEEELTGSTFCQALVTKTGGSYNYVDALEILFKNGVVDTQVVSSGKYKSTIGDYIAGGICPGRFLPILKYLPNEALLEKIYEHDRSKKTLLEVVLPTNEVYSDAYLDDLAQNLSNRFTALPKIMTIIYGKIGNPYQLHDKIRQIWISRFQSCFQSLVAFCVLALAYKNFA